MSGMSRISQSWYPAHPRGLLIICQWHSVTSLSRSIVVCSITLTIPFITVSFHFSWLSITTADVTVFFSTVTATADFFLLLFFTAVVSCQWWRILRQQFLDHDYSTLILSIMNYRDCLCTHVLFRKSKSKTKTHTHSLNQSINQSITLTHSLTHSLTPPHTQTHLKHIFIRICKI